MDEYRLGNIIRLAYLKHGNNSWLSIARDVEKALLEEENKDLRDKLEGGHVKHKHEPKSLEKKYSTCIICGMLMQIKP